MSCPRCKKNYPEEVKVCPECGIEKDRRRPPYEVQLFPLILVSLLLVGALLLDYLNISFFPYVRWVITAAAVYYAYILYRRALAHTWRFWMFSLIALLFNPLTPIFLPSKVWEFWGLMMSIILILYGVRLRNRSVSYFKRFF